MFGHLFLPKEGGRGGAFTALRLWLIARIDAWQPRIIAYEDTILNRRGPKQTSIMTARALMGYVAVVEQLAYERQIRAEGVQPSDIKRFMTGDGWAKKPAMVAAALACGWETPSDHAADALAVMLLIERRFTRVHRKLPVGPLFGEETK